MPLRKFLILDIPFLILDYFGGSGLCYGGLGGRVARYGLPAALIYLIFEIVCLDLQSKRGCGGYLYIYYLPKKSCAMNRSLRLILFFLALGLCSPLLFSQTSSKFPPPGYDAPRSGIAQGKIDSLVYPSITVGSDRKVLVYTPPAFSPDKAYPVLYLLHGIGGDEKEWLNGGRPDILLDNLYADNKAEPMIVVMPNGRAMKDDSAAGNIMAPDKVQAFATFEKDLINDLIPFIEKRYHVKKGSEFRAVAGLSMGGGQSLNFGLGNLSLFAWVGGFSSAPNTKAPEALMPDPAKAKTALKLLWISCGDKDGLLNFSQRTHAYMSTHGVPHVYHVIPGGGHDFGVWKSSLYLFAQLLFKPVDGEKIAKYSTEND